MRLISLSTVYCPELEDAEPIPTICVVENNSGLPLPSVSVCPFDPVIVKYGWPFSTSIDEIVPVTVEVLLLPELDVPVFTVACLPINDAACMTPKLLWNDWKDEVSCC